MGLAPVGVAALIFVVTARFGFELLASLGAYAAVVLGGLALHQLVTLTLVARLLAGLGPMTMLRRTRALLLTAFSMNMNGTALFEGVTVLFLAQAFGVELGLGTQVIVLAMVVLTAVGASGVPSGSIPLLVLILETVGVPGASIALILGIDRILDMARTVPNVTGDLVTSIVVDRWERRDAGTRVPTLADGTAVLR